MREASPSFHPLAVLGIRSQPPRMDLPTEVALPEESQTIPNHKESESATQTPSQRDVENPPAVELASRPDAVPMLAVDDASVVANAESASEARALTPEADVAAAAEVECAPNAPSQEADPAPVAIDDALVRTLAGDVANRFGDEFESRVRELVAQRVAEMVTERLMAALDVTALGHQLKGQLSPPDPAPVRANAGDTSNGSIKKKRSVSRKT